MKKYLLHLVALSALLVTSILPAAAASSWPASDTGTNIGSGLPSGYEPSGIEWLSGRSQFVVVSDEGLVTTMNADGSNVTTWNLGSGYDLEGVAIADAQSSNVYLLDENTSSVFEFDLASGSLTGKSWSFADKLSEVNGAGAEALAYADGSFYVGWQYDGDIYVYSANLASSGSQSFVQEIHMTSGYTDISGLTYNSDTERLYALYDGLNLLEERSLDGTLLTSYSVPGSDQEGIAFINSCASSTATVAIAQDSGGVVSYSGYPVTCVSVPEPEPEPEPTPDPEPVTVSSVSGAAQGDIDVTYSDGTSAHYDVFAINTRQKVSVIQIETTDYYLVTIWRRAAVVDAMTGEVLASRSIPRKYSVLWDWALSVIGL